MRKKINTLVRKSLTVPLEFGERRLDYVISFFTDLSRKEAKEIVENGLVLMNDRRITFPSTKVKKGDRIIILETEKTSTLPEPAILCEDDHIIVVNKPSGFLSEQTGKEKGVALSRILENKGKVVFPVHRLDRETSGVMIFAKTVKARDFLVEEFRDRKINKTYIGIVEGILRQKNGILKGKIQKTNEYAETHYEVTKILKGATLLKLVPKTGRTHQLRLQLAQIGHPVIGDKKYYNLKRTRFFFQRQALHSYKISFVHPETKRWVAFTAPIPDDMKKLIDRLSC
ncbi:MAG: RluA family pseudouridine synthase [candidate division WOR-3 bacterium]